MTDAVVSIRIPTSLVLKLQKQVEQEHFKDLSELVRTIVRKRMLQFEEPQREFGELSRQELLRELEKLIQRLKQ